MRTKYLRKNRQALLEMFLSRAVDNFQKYLADAIREVLRKQPAILKSRQPSLSLEDVLSFSSLDELVRHVIETRVTSLSYEGFRELEEWCLEKGIPLIIRFGEGPKVVELIATRNVIIHNRGLVDEKYRRLVPATPFLVGQVRTIEAEDLFAGVSLLHSIVAGTDHAIALKFGLEQNPISISRDREGDRADPSKSPQRKGEGSGEA